MNGREGFKAMNAKVIVLPKRDLNYKLKLVSNEDWQKKCLFLFSYAFFSPYSAYFSVLSDFLPRFLDLLYNSYFLLSLVALSLSFRPIFTQNPFSTNLDYDNFLRLTKLQLCRYLLFELIQNCKILRITVQLQPHQFGFPLKTRFVI